MGTRVLSETREGDKGIKIYTGTGDSGKTSLFSGERVEKTHGRIEACGEVGELNVCLGILIASIPEAGAGVIEELLNIQSFLFHVGARLSTTPGSPPLPFVDRVRKEDIHALERAIDRMDEQLPPLGGFIVPGGGARVYALHFRALLRRRRFSREGHRLYREQIESWGI